MAEEMIIFTRTFDFTQWILHVTSHFPRSQRFVVTKRLQDAVLDFFELLVLANSGLKTKRPERLKEADGRLQSVRHYIRLCYKMEWLSDGQYHHGAGYLQEIGRLLGGWLKQSLSSISSQR
ncbi:diversity-generating retroelement protein Avd [candidate division KSB1 bacterium]|nr:diversity-generating retroelement protein Avd [candidate division KSB1 bacterium]